MPKVSAVLDSLPVQVCLVGLPPLVSWVARQRSWRWSSAAAVSTASLDGASNCAHTSQRQRTTVWHTWVKTVSALSAFCGLLGIGHRCSAARSEPRGGRLRGRGARGARGRTGWPAGRALHPATKSDARVTFINQHLLQRIYPGTSFVLFRHLVWRVLSHHLEYIFILVYIN